jgi:hypothetical protein
MESDSMRVGRPTILASVLAAIEGELARALYFDGAVNDAYAALKLVLCAPPREYYHPSCGHRDVASPARIGGD